MAKLNNHYERAFQDYVRSLRVACIAVNESQRPLDDEATLKNLDFIITSPRVLLVDVKGRKVTKTRSGLENWITEDDIDSLKRWEVVFGDDAEALLVFVYELPTPAHKEQFSDHWSTRQRHYGFLGVALADYRRRSKTRSPRWSTVTVPRGEFRECAKPLSHWLKR